MGKESLQWEIDKKNGNMDDLIYPDWVVPCCSLCKRQASLALMPSTYAAGTLSSSPCENAEFYCEDHCPEKYKRGR